MHSQLMNKEFEFEELFKNINSVYPGKTIYCV